ncbi:hypothetical protein [Candidatus Leptofilum sp.]|uniref:hypothetical protein n=1 Tax=Candidatus Leptofilum sp. TaxID=3241576 RepID=UPI003B58E9F2
MNWVQHFSGRPQLKLEQYQGEHISELESRRIGDSIAQFQRGESSEARDFLEKSQTFSRKSGNPTFFEESKLFVQEENYHSYLLAIFMNQSNICMASDAWADNVFRWIRSFGDIAWSSRVLLTAEILAQVYYPALKEATSSSLLRAICERIIEDEEYHILFQTERIARVLQHHSRIYLTIHSLLGLSLFLGTTLVVWLEHRKVLSSSLSFLNYFKASFGYYRFAMAQLSSFLTSQKPTLEDLGSYAK